MDDVTPTGTEATELGGSFARWALIAIWLLSLAWGIATGVFAELEPLDVLPYLTLLIGGYLLNVLIKTLFARPRPTFADPIAVLQSYSFPSGHAMLSLITFGMLAYFLRKRLKTRHVRMIAVFGVMLLVVLIGISRMALGVHYLSDVIAGYAAGGVWLISCIIAAQRFERKKHNADMGERTPE